MTNALVAWFDPSKNGLFSVPITSEVVLNRLLLFNGEMIGDGNTELIVAASIADFFYEENGDYKYDFILNPNPKDYELVIFTGKVEE